MSDEENGEGGVEEEVLYDVPMSMDEVRLLKQIRDLKASQSLTDRSAGLQLEDMLRRRNKNMRIRRPDPTESTSAPNESPKPNVSKKNDEIEEANKGLKSPEDLLDPGTGY